MARTKQTARLRPAGSEAPPAPKRKKLGSKTIAETSENEYRLICSILGFSVHTNFPTGKSFGYSSFSASPCTAWVYPVLTREPSAPGTLPVVYENGDKGYFLGASDPSHIRLAIIEAFIKTHPHANLVNQPWKDTTAYKYNLAYYTKQNFEKSGTQDLTVLSEEILHSREWGGDKDRPTCPVARVCVHNKTKLAVYLADYFAQKAPEGIEPGTFFNQNEMMALHARYQADLDTRLAKIGRKTLEKKLDDASEDEDDE